MRSNFSISRISTSPSCVSSKDIDSDVIEDDDEEVIPSSQKYMRTTGLSLHLNAIRIPESPVPSHSESWSGQDMDVEEDSDPRTNIMAPISQSFRKRTSWNSDQRDALWSDVIDANDDDSVDDTQMGEVPVVFPDGSIFHFHVHCSKSESYNDILKRVRPQIKFSLDQARVLPIIDHYLAFKTVPETNSLLCGKRGIAMPNSRRFLICFVIEHDSTVNNDTMDISL